MRVNKRDGFGDASERNFLKIRPETEDGGWGLDD
jgi:hypothetical protein